MVWIIILVSFIASLLTFFSGFGLGTLLTPVFALFFPLPTAITLTAIVHFLNNIFKLGLVFKNINWPIAFRFGIASIAGALIGAYCLNYLDSSSLNITYHLFHKELTTSFLKITVALLLIVFALFELIPVLKKIEFGTNKLLIGGIITGFFGGLTGNQGALRSAFLIRFNLTKEMFIATGIIIACMVDISRLSVYMKHFSSELINNNSSLLIGATISAFAGAFIGSKALKKVTLSFVQNIVACMLLLIATLLGLGVI